MSYSRFEFLILDTICDVMSNIDLKIKNKNIKLKK
jgi:hypothetical protein